MEVSRPEDSRQGLEVQLCDHPALGPWASFSALSLTFPIFKMRMFKIIAQNLSSPEVLEIY